MKNSFRLERTNIEPGGTRDWYTVRNGAGRKKGTIDVFHFKGRPLQVNANYGHYDWCDNPVDSLCGRSFTSLAAAKRSFRSPFHD